MIRFRLTVIILLCFLIPSSFCQSESIPWYSLKRFSFNYGFVYHNNPWKNYNNVVDVQANNVMVDPHYLNPKGSYEHIIGDLSIRSGLRYRLMKRLHIGFTISYGQTVSGFEFYPEFETLYYGDFITTSLRTPAYQQEILFQYESYGAEILYDLLIRDNLQISIVAGLENVKCFLDLDWIYDYRAVGPVEKGEGHILRSRLIDNNLGWYSSFELKFRLIRSIHLLLAMDYRNHILSDFKGKATIGWTHKTWDDELYKHKGDLVESPTYFGFRISEDEDPVYYYGFPPFWPQGDKDQKPATIDLTSFGFRIGFNIGL